LIDFERFLKKIAPFAKIVVINDPKDNIIVISAP
jgi:hypothetical protein